MTVARLSNQDFSNMVRAKRRRRAARLSLHQRGVLVDASNARFASVRAYVPECMYVEYEGDEALTQARRGLVWAHRMVRRDPDFVEQVVRYELALDRAKRDALKKNPEWPNAKEVKARKATKTTRVSVPVAKKKQMPKKKNKRTRRCVDCGTPISADAKRCVVHANNERAARSKRWTRERVIESIQRWAEKNGRPPLSDEWVVRGDDHPARSSVYGQKSQPFKKWSDAIVAAGFPNPSHSMRPKSLKKRSREQRIADLQQAIKTQEETDAREQLVEEAERLLNKHADIATRHWRETKGEQT